jgi:hypothetical protein
MLATFVITTTGGGTATFIDRVAGSSQSAGVLPRFVLTGLVADEAAWRAYLALVTTEYSVRSPYAGLPIVDIKRGPGEGTLTMSYGAASAILIDLRRTQYLNNAGRSLVEATFLITSTWT